MNNHLANKKSRYEQISKSDCFQKTLKGLATIELNITEMCSRKCSFCPRHDSNVYKNQPLFMSYDTANALSSNCLTNHYEGDISFAGFGEPMIHPDLPKFIQSFSNNYTTVITNGDFLNKDSLSKMIDAGLKKIVVSCYDGPEERDKFRELLTPISIEWNIRELWGTFEEIVVKNNFNSRTGLVPIVNTASDRRCFIPFYKLFVDWNGDILLCSNDWHRKQKGLHNINTTPLTGIWLSETMMGIRTDLAKGNRCGDACKNCTVNGTLIGQESFKLLSPLSPSTC